LELQPVVLNFDRLPVPQVRGNSRCNWRVLARYVKAEREHGHAIALEALQGRQGDGFPWQVVSVHFDFYNAAWVDYANLAKGVKPWEDGVTDAGIWPDDSPRYIQMWSLTFHKTEHRNEAQTVMTITRIE
jgi:hypothetical protein